MILWTYAGNQTASLSVGRPCFLFVCAFCSLWNRKYCRKIMSNTHFTSHDDCDQPTNNRPTDTQISKFKPHHELYSSSSSNNNQSELSVRLILNPYNSSRILVEMDRALLFRSASRRFWIGPRCLWIELAPLDRPAGALRSASRRLRIGLPAPLYRPPACLDRPPGAFGSVSSA